MYRITIQILYRVLQKITVSSRLLILFRALRKNENTLAHISRFSSRLFGRESERRTGDENFVNGLLFFEGINETNNQMKNDDELGDERKKKIFK